jgi:hypothetical protein
MPLEKWQPKRCERVLSIRFVVDGDQICAIGVLVKDEFAYEPLFLVGPMANLRGPISEEEAAKAARAYPDWHAFYKKLFHSCGKSRPLALVCPGPDCPMTPEIPPPGLLGMTTSYGSGSIAALEPGFTERAYASRATAGGQIATDAVQGMLAQSKDARRTLVVDTAARAVCAAKILTVPK